MSFRESGQGAWGRERGSQESWACSRSLPGHRSAATHGGVTSVRGQEAVSVSPCCRYLVTFSPLMDTQDDPQAIIIWDILTGQKKRGFHCESSAHWPIFK